MQTLLERVLAITATYAVVCFIIVSLLTSPPSTLKTVLITLRLKNQKNILHGFLGKNISDEQLRRIVVTSRDFGRAYLTERWASRFVTELLRRFSVCFVGYSVDDP